ncbi:MAG TPA: hypothetical protein DDZ68_03685 [Parvularcula sp.]|nr:hypothetical protein [Parvularcula sp.]HBS31112.1 hypothetical protein [Parvularcula sp.]HBS33606.1 hypothetical protein [Parvularcula sp.]
MFKSNPVARALRKPGLKWLRALAAAVIASSASVPATAQTSQADSVDALHAAFLFNFAKFTTWPTVNDLDTSIKFCVQSGAIGQEAFAGWGKKRIQNRPVRVAFFSQFTESDLQNCSILFFSEPPQGADMKWLAEVSAANNTLMVSDIEGFSAQGGHIELYLANRRLRFKVNLGALEKARLSLGAGVLNLAEIVSPTGAPK